MDGLFEVRRGNDVVGKVQLISQGLYTRVICRCDIAGDQVFRLYGMAGDCRENLGVLVPEADGFVLDKRIPAKRLRENMTFRLSSGAGTAAGTFIPIHPEEPFCYIDRLKTAFLENRQGQLGICIPKTPEAG